MSIWVPRTPTLGARRNVTLADGRPTFAAGFSTHYAPDRIDAAWRFGGSSLPSIGGTQ
jgi:hypothetical protein